MNTIELQNTLIKKILDTKGSEILNYFNQILSTENQPLYKLNDIEKQFVRESLVDYQSSNVVSNDDVFSKTEKWLEE